MRLRPRAAAATATTEKMSLPVKGVGWVCVCAEEEGGSVAVASELADGSQNMKQCRGNVWWVRCTELQAREQAC